MPSLKLFSLCWLKKFLHFHMPDRKREAELGGVYETLKRTAFWVTTSHFGLAGNFMMQLQNQLP